MSKIPCLEVGDRSRPSFGHGWTIAGVRADCVNGAHARWNRRSVLGRFLLLCLVLGLGGCRANPGAGPIEAGQSQLVELTRIEPGIRLDIRYATTDNFSGRVLYPEARAFLQRPAAEALARAHRALAKSNRGLLVYDAYRPWSVTKALWESATESQRAEGFVADPAEGSKHNRGCAVDVGLFDLRSGRALPMPSEYDEFSARANPGYSGGKADARGFRDQLRTAMEAEGFEISKNEWWHFNWRNWRSYPVLDIPFSAIRP